ncbi:response regulator [Butyrivibrio proteoclasticus]|uniref:response regulator n=1 Tax=Butyrivibrio proteoclasticus TaxID=43305 RepID=UPI000684AA2C|nr:response regulator [Butyrivibrio proteoclasticus]
MEQRTYFVRDLDELNNCIAEIKELPAFKEAMSVLALMYVNGFNSEEARPYVDGLKRSMPKAVVSGLAVMNSSDKWDENGISISFIFFESSKVDLYTYEASRYSEEEIIDLFTKAINNTPDVRAVLTYPVNSIGYFYRVLDAVAANVDEHISFFGEMACSNNYYVADTRISSIFSIGDGIINWGCVFVVLSGEKLRHVVKYVLGWNSLGKAMQITANAEYDRFGNTGITEIDGMPAVEIYKKYLDIDVDEYFSDNVCEFPITVQRNGAMIARVPIYTNENGVVFVAGDIESNEKIKLSFGVPFEVIRAAQKAAEEVAKFGSQALIISVCYNRYHFLHERATQEIQGFEKNHKELLYGFGGPEILKSQGKGGVLNSALAVLGLREGECTKGSGDVIVSVEEEKKAVKPLLDRLISFVDVSTKELEDAYDAANQASSSKSSFLSNMSHEIRTPITAVMGMNEMILRECRDEQIIEYAQNSKTASLNLLRIVNDILDFSKIEAGKMEIVPVEYEVASVLNDLVNMVRKRAEDKGLEFRLSLDPMIPHLLYGDEIRLKQVVTNILTNAVKYTHKGGVVLSVRWKACSLEEMAELDDNVARNLEGNERFADNEVITLEISVEDTGIGIKPEDMDKLFSSFERVDEKRNRTIEGTGLGINITQNLLKLMGSELKVESEYNVGSRFYFDVKQKVVDETPIGDFEDAIRRSLSAKEEYHESFIAPNAKILVVDDTEMNLTVFKNLLKKTRIQIHTATSGQECLEMIKREKYDIIFMDHRMPKMDGIECLQHIKEDREGLNYDTPVIALTANAVSGSREMYLNAGFDNYLTKPIHGEILEQGLMEYLPEDLVTRVDVAKLEAEFEQIPVWMTKAPLMNEKIGLKNCGDLESYTNALIVYAESADNMDEAIYKAWKEERIKDYSIKVHALKSSSRVVGAMEIGALAETLEKAGDEENVEMIDQLTDELLIYHKAFATMLNRYLKKEEYTTQKEEISKEKLAEAYMTIKEIAMAFDYDSLVTVMDNLKDYYSIPEAEKERYEKLKNAVNNADWEEILTIVEG